MTENEAKTKWCPFARITGATESHHAMDNRGDLIDPMRVAGLCLGSACMAWRPTFEDRGIHGSHVKSGGFCGLAGVPS